MKATSVAFVLAIGILSEATEQGSPVPNLPPVRDWFVKGRLDKNVALKSVRVDRRDKSTFTDGQPKGRVQIAIGDKDQSFGAATADYQELPQPLAEAIGQHLGLSEQNHPQFASAAVPENASATQPVQTSPQPLATRGQPPVVTTTEGIEIPIQYGAFQIPKGSTLKVVAINPNGSVEVEFNGQKYSIPSAKTDLEKRVAEIRTRRIVIDGTAYEDFTFSDPTAVDVKLVHRTGAVRIPFKKLPPELQQRLGYDQQKQPESLQQQAEQQRRAELSKNSQRLMGLILQVTPEGLLTQTQTVRFREAVARTPPTGPLGTERVYLGKKKGPVVLIVGHPRANQATEGESVDCFGYQDGTASYPGNDGVEQVVQRWIYVGAAPPQ